MAYRRKQGVARGSTFREEILNPSPNLNESSPASSLAAKAIRASSAHRDSSLSSAYGYGHSPQPTSTNPIPSSPSSSTSTSTSASTSTKDSTGYEYTSMKSLGEPKQGFWGVLARKAKAIIDDDNVAPQCESPRRTGLQMPDTARKGRYYDPYQSPESRSKTDSPPLQKGLGAIASSLNYIGGTIGNALEEGLTIVENRTADIIQETRKLQVRKKGSRSEARNQASTVSDTQQQPPLQQHPLQTHMQPSTQTDLEIQLKASRDVAMAMAAKAKLLLRELKTVKADLAFAKERCAQLEEENRILRESRDKGDNLEDDDLIRLQLETLLAEKARLAQENSVFARENRFLREIVEYHQLTMQDVVYLDEGSEEVTEVYPIKVPPTVTNLPSLTTNPSLVPHSLSPLSPNPQVTHNRSPLHIPSSEPVELSQTIIPTSPYINIPVVEEHQERH